MKPEDARSRTPGGLRGLSDEEIVALMAEGVEPLDDALHIRLRTPPWAAPSDIPSLRSADLNRRSHALLRKREDVAVGELARDVDMHRGPPTPDSLRRLATRVTAEYALRLRRQAMERFSDENWGALGGQSA